MSVPFDLMGQRFGRFTVIELSPNRYNGQFYWLCRCDCGVEKHVGSYKLRRGISKSCGCWRDELTSSGAINRTHGQTRTPEWRAWFNMKRRCRDVKGRDHKYYKAQGVTVAPEWLEDFPAFLAHVGPRPSTHHSLDRFPNPWGNYEPGNVRWATRTEQQQNRRLNKPRTHQ